MAFDASKMTDTQTAIISPTFHTLQVHQELNPQAPPVITLNSDDRLVISFDELADERRYLRYELIHCNARWRPDGMLAPEYVDGFNEATIDDYDYSRATTVRYINYRLTFPSPDMRPLISGNYLLRVYDEQDPDATLLQVRFSVLEPMTTVTATVTSRTDIDYNDRHQQLTIGVDATEIPAGDMYSSMLINVMQNGRHDNMAYTARPTRIAGTTAWFEHDRNLIFPAGKAIAGGEYALCPLSKLCLCLWRFCSKNHTFFKNTSRNGLRLTSKVMLCYTETKAVHSALYG